MANQEHTQLIAYPSTKYNSWCVGLPLGDSTIKMYEKGFKDKAEAEEHIKKKQRDARMI